ncbi:hypothetical protein [Polaromonas sp.]|jgi:hypothetical protein|uniref:hypothetical protein n=1 Tax=Polaromonas sp. TaxID=1869339 RepID=UPI001D46FD92|nr:hypothetical protein [Polaromonas sp.]MBT9476000.1 hypothetical protein [Polaromonas sp.]
MRWQHHQGAATDFLLKASALGFALLPTTFRRLDMRAIFSVVSLMIVLAVVGVLVKKQLQAPPLGPASLERPDQLDSILTPPVDATGSRPQATNEQLQQQIGQSIESSMRQARPIPDD